MMLHPTSTPAGTASLMPTAHQLLAQLKSLNSSTSPLNLSRESSGLCPALYPNMLSVPAQASRQSSTWVCGSTSPVPAALSSGPAVLSALSALSALSSLRTSPIPPATMSPPPAGAAGAGGTTGRLQQLLAQLQTQQAAQQAMQQHAHQAMQQHAQQAQNAQQAQQLQAQQQQIKAQQELVQQLTQALAAAQSSQTQLRQSLSPVPGAMHAHCMSPLPHASPLWPQSNSNSARGSPVPPANGMTLNGEWVSRDQFLRIYTLRSKQTCGTSEMDQVAAGRSMVVAGIFHLPPKTIRDIWARTVGAEWTCAGWSDRERHIHMSGGREQDNREQQSETKKRKAPGTAKQQSSKASRKMESDM